MGSSWRYVPAFCNNDLLDRGISGAPLYVFHKLACTFSLDLFFTGSHFASVDKPVNSLVGEKLRARIEVNRKTNHLIAWPHLFTAFSNPSEPPLYPTRSHLLSLPLNAAT